MNKKRTTRVIASALTIAAIMMLNPLESKAAWKKNNVGWWYTEGNSWATGWRYIDGNWYYFYSDGYMATNDKIGDYFVNSSGVWTNEITASEARQLVINEDYDFVNNAFNTSSAFSNSYNEYNTNDVPYTTSWSVPKEPMYEFTIGDYDSDGTYLNDYCSYLVGKNSKNVYVIPNQGNMDVYQVHDNKVVKRIPWKGIG